MRLKETYTWMKHWDFILIDLICLMIAFITSYYLKFGDISFFLDLKWRSLFIIICCMNLAIMIFQSTYSGILKRRYYQQFRREILLFVTQIATICTAFYAFKIGTFFSREMLFTMYYIYFVTAQIAKYIRKKILTGEFSFKKKQKIKNPEMIKSISGEDMLELECLNESNEFLNFLSKVLKRFIDIIGGIVGCIILIPLTLIVFILNKLNTEDDGPVFYLQERIGQNGKPFQLIKFRSMVVDADEKLERFLEENEDIRKEYMIYRKIKNDPRVTKVGEFLRKTSLDEFPQFINVLLGDMSLIGPRPYLRRELNDMGKYYDIIIQYKPGITGLWQVSGRSDVSFGDRLDMDISYHKDHSMNREIKILFKTIEHVINREGAI